MEILEMKNNPNENPMDKLHSRMEMTKERVGELEITSTETIQTEEQRGKTQQKVEQNICCCCC